MKKISLLLFAIVSLCAISINSFAAEATTANKASAKPSDYYSTKHHEAKTANNTSLKTQCCRPATDIAIYNGSHNVIFAVVPFSPINDVIYPGTIEHIYHDTMYADTHIVLQDPYRHTFFDAYVCRHASITVYGMPGSYDTHISCY